jgi:hypothetical protein
MTSMVQIEILGVTAGVAVNGTFRPDQDAVVDGVATVSFRLDLGGTENVPLEGRLRQIERIVADEIARRLNAFPDVVMERDTLKLRQEQRDNSSAGFRTAELMSMG